MGFLAIRCQAQAGHVCLSLAKKACNVTMTLCTALAVMNYHAILFPKRAMTCPDF
jgi:hypothetical protein